MGKVGSSENERGKKRGNKSRRDRNGKALVVKKM
ncbi:uncharacterized protein J3R85_016763 [Psidium guajava]|nr:uncharacterized protein J3R85_016763 [Psidium guajava]